ncbi:hypothetical protein CH254_20980 [Rhodococcus sp. 06-412-2C]|uniref:hypothetical protein n=1 Tax=unclassified Rhodococcus (in: high G+C Gram-positive bacteria) TaxID=192944 RepID=UPI000B9BBC4C|nr:MULTISPECIES: hypothetical protein [unclassified Rhodococcus (in: high G+C Gram-positive bacteria)]OZC84856.1 hypothetical protein CH254_20980 [Rhodococcus sp. 06-412-2C]OZC98508.1 hypothetical protein CH279_13625 [Rhodococcus sp. 06-412-2B]
MIDNTNTGLFTEFRKEHRLLSGELEKLACDGGVQAAIDDIKTVEQLDDFSRRWPNMLKEIRPPVPKLGGTRMRTADGVFKPVAGSSVEHRSTRYLLAIQVEGDAHLLPFWPNEVDDVPEPAANDMWRFGQETEPIGSATAVLHTYIDLTRDEEIAAAADGTNVRKLFEQRINHLEKLVSKIAEQTENYFDRKLPNWLTDHLSRQREILEQREAITKSLDFERGWKIAPPALDPPTIVGGIVGDPEISTPTSSAVHDVPLRDRLASATFEDVVKVIRLWANAVERTPDAFALLKEDHLSDLLAATLNATLPGAAREVFTRTGKSDIFISADKLDEGRGPAKVFICEAKIANDDATVTRALDPQLFSYLNTHDTAAVLLLFFKQKNPEAAKARRLTALQESVAGFVKGLDDLCGWPLLEYRVEERTVRICVASVNLARYAA